jgi:hypothetical protein
MSRQMIGVVIHALLTNEDVRLRFVIDPLEALAHLNLRGVELTSDEIDVLVRTDVRQLWFWNGDLLDARMH